jgi:uncharacterized membrane protein YagU involved in acid resistance
MEVSIEELHENKFGYKIAITEMKYRLDSQYEAITAVKNVTQQVFASSSLIIALIAALRIFNSQVSDDFLPLYTILVGIVMLLYIALIILCLKVLLPVKINLPIPDNLNELYDGFISKEDEIDILKQQLINYLDTIELNKPIIDHRHKLSRCATILLPIIVIILLGMGFLPKS